MCPHILAVLLAAAVSQAEPVETAAPTVAPESSTSGHWLCDWFGPMPQTCYEPRYGCYPGNARFTNRYPAFHGYYYRAPYNYRHLYEYPWHAAPHHPLPFDGVEATETSEEIPLSSRFQPGATPRTAEAPAKTAMTPKTTR